VTRLRSALVVTSPATATRAVVTRVSQATRLVGSARRQWSRMASLIWSATLSGWPIDTDSLVKRKRLLDTANPLKECPRRTHPVLTGCDYRKKGCDLKEGFGLSARAGYAFCSACNESSGFVDRRRRDRRNGAPEKEEAP